MLKFDLSGAIKELKKKKAKRVLVQVPEGLKTKTNEIIIQLQKKGIEGIAGMDPCFGACDVKPDEAKRLGCNAVLHLGHTQFTQTKGLPIIYAPLEYILENFEETTEKITRYLLDKNIKSVGLVSTAQYLKYLPLLKKKLDKKGIKTEIGKGKRVENGQVLGCNYSSATVKAKTIIYLGDGFFHPLGIHFGSGKEVLITNPINGDIKELIEEKNDFLRKRFLTIEKAKEANTFAILVSTKVGQNRISIAEKIKKEIEKKGKKAIICAMDFISEEKLLGLEVDAYINTACPRISIDDYASYKKPMLNYNEIQYVLGKSYENYVLETIY